MLPFIADRSKFRSLAAIDWASFRRWAKNNWGCSLNDPLHKLDDDIWLLFCDSKSRVDRILSLNRKSFNGIPILLDKWIPEAGLSRVLAEDGVIWITIRGIPIHLRSSDLFRQLGEVCGEFLGYEICSSLSSVRIRIKTLGSLPKEISLKHGGSSFTVKVFSDQAEPTLVQAPLADSCVQRLAKGKSVLSTITGPCFGSSDVFEVGSSSAGPQSTPGKIDLQASSLCSLPSFSSPEALVERQEEVILPMLSSDKDSDVSGHSAFPPLGSHFVGLSLDVKDDLWLVSSSGLDRTIPLLKLSSGLGQSGSGNILVGKVSFSPSFMGSLKQAFSLPSLNKTGLLLDLHLRTSLIRPSSSSPSAESSYLPLFPNDGQEVLELESPTTPLVGNPVSSPSSPSLSLFSSTVKEVAILYGLELDGSKDLGIA
ncbi:hypothetical protein LINPERHAP2_LOCUS27773 [Linum perenne]